MLLFAPSSRDRKAVPPVARMTAGAEQVQVPPSCNRRPDAPATDPSPCSSNFVAGWWSRMVTPARRTARITRMYSGPLTLALLTGCPSLTGHG